MIIGIQFISIGFSTLMLYITFLHFKKRELAMLECVFFTLIWCGAILLTIYPKSVNFILQTFNIYRLLDLATIVGFMILIAISFLNYLEIKKLKKKIEKLTRHIAMK